MVVDCNRVDSARASQNWQRLLGWLKEVEIRPKKKQNITTRSHGLKKKRGGLQKERHTETYDLYSKRGNVFGEMNN